MRLAGLVLPLVLALPLALGASRAHAKPEEVAPLQVGDEAPAFSIRTLNPDRSAMKVFSTGRFAGPSADEPKRAVVLSFAASYCEPCKRELAELGTLEARLAKANVVLAVVIIDTEQKGIDEMQKLTVDTLKLPYPIVLDRFGVVARRYRATSLPFTVVIGKNGLVEWAHAGYQDGALDALAKQLGI